VAIALRPGDDDSLLHAMRTMRANLARVIGELRHGTRTIAGVSSQIAAGNQDSSERTEQQAGSLEETASSMEEMTAAVRQNADSARAANELAVNAPTIAAKGGAVVASEVRNLAQRSAAAAKEIKDSIADSVGQVDVGSKLVSEAGHRLAGDVGTGAPPGRGGERVPPGRRPGSDAAAGA